jgi:hypothetical protein
MRVVFIVFLGWWNSPWAIGISLKMKNDGIFSVNGCYGK